MIESDKLDNTVINPMKQVARTVGSLPPNLATSPAERIAAIDLADPNKTNEILQQERLNLTEQITATVDGGTSISQSMPNFSAKPYPEV